MSDIEQMTKFEQCWRKRRMKHGKAVVAALLGTMLMVTGLSGCGSREVSDTNDGEYQKINLSMAVNGTDTQIDSLVAHHFADLVAERSDGNWSSTL